MSDNFNIRLTTSTRKIDRMLFEASKEAERLTIRALSRLGEECVIEARDRSPEASWFDQTGNLRSSIGYVIVANGDIIHLSGFNHVKYGSEGAKTGKDLAIELAKRYNSGYALIVVAGMNYAERVEALDNKVVLASAELYAQNKLPEMRRKLVNQIANISFV